MYFFSFELFERYKLELGFIFQNTQVDDMFDFLGIRDLYIDYIKLCLRMFFGERKRFFLLLIKFFLVE